MVMLFFCSCSTSFDDEYCLHLFHEIRLYLSCRYWRFSEESRAVDKDYPRHINVWGSIPDSPKGAFLSDDGGESELGDECPGKQMSKNRRVGLIRSGVKENVTSLRRK